MSLDPGQGQSEKRFRVWGPADKQQRQLSARLCGFGGSPGLSQLQAAPSDMAMAGLSLPGEAEAQSSRI